MKRENKFKTSALVSKGAFMVLIALLLFFSISLLREVKRKQAIQDEIKHLEEELARLEPENQQFSTLIEYLQTDEYAELEAKKRLGMKRDGEQVILVTESQQTTGQQEYIPLIPETNWQLWWRHFFN